MSKLQSMRNGINKTLEVRFGFSKWPYAEVYKILMDWLAIIYNQLSPDSVETFVGIPSLVFGKLGRTKLWQYTHEYAGNGTLGQITFNIEYIKPNPTPNELSYYIMLLGHALCQCMVIREKGELLKAEVDNKLGEIGIICKGTKRPLKFTECSWLQEALQAQYKDAVDNVAVPEIKPAKKREKKVESSTNEQITFITEQPQIITTNATKFEQITMPDIWKDKYDDLLKKFEDQQKTIQELKAKIEAFKPALMPMPQMPIGNQELANATN